MINIVRVMVTMYESVGRDCFDSVAFVAHTYIVYIASYNFFNVFLINLMEDFNIQLYSFFFTNRPNESL